MPEIRLCATGDVASGLARRYVVGKLPIAVVHAGDEFFAIHDVCSHQKIPLSEGEVDVENKLIECYKHGSCFSLVDGHPNTLPATKPVPVYPVRVQGDDVMVMIP